MVKRLLVPVKYPYEVQTEWAFMKWMDIPSNVNVGYVYLRRLRVVQVPWAGIYLHFIFEPDADRDPHNHPRQFWSMILRGSYEELVYKNVRLPERHWSVTRWRWPRFSRHHMPLDWAHRIIKIEPGTVSLLLVGRRRQPWGFFTADGFVPHRQYNRAAPNKKELA